MHTALCQEVVWEPREDPRASPQRSGAGKGLPPRDADDSAQLSEGGTVPRAREEGVSLMALEQQHSYEETGWFQASCSL